MLKRKILATVVLFVLFSGICVGYAALTDTLSIIGSANVKPKPFEGVYIYAAELVSTDNAVALDHAYVHPTNFSCLANTARTGSVTYKITVHNNSNVTCWYLRQDYETGVMDNSLIAGGGITVITKDHVDDTTKTFNSDDWIPPKTMRDFYVTYTYGESALGYRETFINFRFGAKIDAVYDKFLTVLNDKITDYGYDYISDYFDAKYVEDGTTVIGNLGEDKALFDHLFGSEMTINVDGEEVPVTVMVRRDNVDKSTSSGATTGSSPAGSEYTVYITVDPLDSPTGEAIVYAVSYSCDESGTWHQLGQLYEGTAAITDYDTTDSVYEGAFDVYSWEATAKEYEMADGIVYKVGYEQGDQYDKLKTIEDLMSTYDQDIFNDIDNRRILKTVYDILKANEGSADPAVIRLREAFVAAAPYYNNLNNGQEFKIKRDSTRAELIPYILNIQTALDYYYQAKQ